MDSYFSNVGNSFQMTPHSPKSQIYSLYGYLVASDLLLMEERRQAGRFDRFLDDVRGKYIKFKTNIDIL